MVKRPRGKYCSHKCMRVGVKGKIPWNKGQKTSEETKQKMSTSHKGNQCAKGNKFTEEQRVYLSQKRRLQKRPPMTEEGKKKISQSLKRLYENGYIHPNLGGTISDEQKQYLSLLASKQAEGNIFLRTKVSYPYDIFCQSSSESAFIEKYYEYFYSLQNCTINRGKSIKTPFGYYVPDFKVSSDTLGESFIEIKSTWTYKCLFNRNKKQLDKINWINDNTDKQVHIIVI